MVVRSTIIAAALCIAAVSYGTGPDADAVLFLDDVPLHAGWVLWATVPVVAQIDGGAPFALGPQQSHVVAGGDDVVETRGAGPYLVQMCAPGDLPPGAGWSLALPLVGR